MPTYHIYDTSVKLYVWDPHQTPRRAIEEKTNNNAVFPIDPAYGRDIEPLKEEYFDGHEGIDFLGSDMPFFLCRSGEDLFYKARKDSANMTELSVDQGLKEQSSVEEESKGSDKLRSRKVRPSADDRYDDDEGHSTLSSISSSMLAESSPLEIAARTLRNATLRTGGNDEGNHRKPKSEPQAVVSKPITTTTPIMVHVELSKKSFMKSIITNDHQDICVSIFLNGQFTCSRVVRSRTAISFAAERMVQPFGGRRVDTNLEVPWVILPLTQDDTSVSDNVKESSSFADRWDKINQLLLQEADQWGWTGKYDIFRTPVGGYLAELSKRGVPESMKNSGTAGSKAGIIDVVVSVGRSTTITSWSNLTAPQRKLPQQVCGKHQQLFVVPEESNHQRKAQIIAQFEREETTRASNTIKNRQFRTQSSEHAYSFNRITTKRMHPDDIRNKPTSIIPMQNFQPVELQAPSSSQPLTLVMESTRLKHRGSVSASLTSTPQHRPSTKEVALPTTPAGGQTRGLSQPHVTPVNAHKNHKPSRKDPPKDPWEFLPFDAQLSPSGSTRSKRSKSISASTPDNLRGQELVDSYLTLRNRQLGALPIVSIECPSHLKPVGEGIAFLPGISSESESNSSRPSTRSDLKSRPSSILHTEGDASKETGLGLDGANKARKRKSDTSIVSASTPERSSKRKRPSPGSPLLDSSESPPRESSKSANGTNVIPKYDAISGNSAQKFRRNPQNQLEMDEKGQNFAALLGTADISRPEEPAKKKQRKPSRAMSTRELSSLLTPHKPAMEVNTSFGASFAEASSARPTRNQPTRQDKVANEAKIETLQSDPPHVIANYQMPMLIIGGVEDLTLESVTRNLVKNTSRRLRNAASEPPPNKTDSEQANRATANEKFGKINKPEKRAPKTFKAGQDGPKASTTSVSTAMQSVKTLGLKTSRFDAKSHTNLLQGDKNADNAAFRPSMGMKPKGTTEPRTALNSRPLLLSHRGISTPTPNSRTFTTPKHIGTPTTLTHTISSSATMINTLGTASTMSSRVVPDSNLRRSAPRPITTTTLRTTGSSNATSMESRLSNSSELADLAWKPNFLCADSVLSYATENVVQGWAGNEYASKSGSAYRGTKQEREAVFRASGILMGVRFVLGGESGARNHWESEGMK
ncbi:hypothetical protein N431DRAFT_463611 [Stipitochalara longipes BDJ]|nr:hypothetical protein N431DRAFT_463611 [Stipitochalara longipes BDJ]